MASPGDFSDRDPKKVDEPEKPRDAVEVQLTFTPGEDEGPAQPVATLSDEVGTGLAPAVAPLADTATKIQEEVELPAHPISAETPPPAVPPATK